MESWYITLEKENFSILHNCALDTGTPQLYFASVLQAQRVVFWICWRSMKLLVEIQQNTYPNSSIFAENDFTKNQK